MEKKMTTETLQKNRQEYQKQIKDLQADIDKKFTRDFNKWVKSNIKFKIGDVLELVKNGIKRRGYSRFVIYEFDPKFFGGSLLVTVYGWWLNAKNVPTKWDGMCIHGAGNSAEFKLSENQIALPHPDSKNPQPNDTK